MKAKKNNLQKIINDPLYGFIHIPTALIFELIEHPIFQRLRGISQTGLSYLVYPGSHHTRFQHSIGCLHLMQKALDTLLQKGVEITEEEYEATCIAILLHDIGHGPFSHALENSIIHIHHEKISLHLLQVLNEKFDNKLCLAINIFQGTYPKKFLTELISSQLDIDRLDYLMRDSFYTGVAEGKISTERLISMMTVVDDEIVIEAKGIYSVENFIIARLFMYWQVYLHKTSVGAELLLTKILHRAKELIQKGTSIWTTPELAYFLTQIIDNLNDTSVSNFLNLTDTDIVMAIKQWQKSEDEILANLSKMLITRKLYKSKEVENTDKQLLFNTFGLNSALLNQEYYATTISIQHLAYNKQKPIKLLLKTGEIKPLHEISNQLDFESLSKKVQKIYFCFSKQLC